MSLRGLIFDVDGTLAAGSPDPAVRGARIAENAEGGWKAGRERVVRAGLLELRYASFPPAGCPHHPR